MYLDIFPKKKMSPDGKIRRNIYSKSDSILKRSKIGKVGQAVSVKHIWEEGSYFLYPQVLFFIYIPFVTML